MAEHHERQYNLDLLKGLAIICMVFCHPVIRLGMFRSGYGHEFWYVFGDCILGAYIVAAHGFMLAMGVGMVYSRKNTPGYLIHRGIKIFLLGYVLNFFRYGIYVLAYDIAVGETLEETMEALFAPDILQFAGLALIATGLFRKMKLNEIHMLVIGLILSVIGTAAAFVDTQNSVLNLILGSFIYTTEETSMFCFCNWYIFVAAGLLFGKILQATPNKDILYKRLLIASGVTALFYIAGSGAFGMFFLSKANEYYAASPLEAAGLLAIDFVFLSGFYFLLKKVDVSRFRYLIEMSKNITSIYCIHWCILGFTEVVFCFLLGWTPNYAMIYTYGAVLLVVSFFLARLYKTYQKKRVTRLKAVED